MPFIWHFYFWHYLIFTVCVYKLLHFSFLKRLILSPWNLPNLSTYPHSSQPKRPPDIGKGVQTSLHSAFLNHYILKEEICQLVLSMWPQSCHFLK